jgi:hypothetical protein
MGIMGVMGVMYLRGGDRAVVDEEAAENDGEVVRELTSNIRHPTSKGGAKPTRSES